MKINHMLFALSTLFLTFSANAQTCGKLISDQFVPQGNYSVVLAKHNDKRLNIPKADRLPLGDLEASGFVALNLKPGLHSFSGYAVCAQNFCEQSSIFGGSEADEINFSIEIEEGTRYTIAAKPVTPRNLIPGKRFEIVVLTEAQSSCQGAEARDALEEKTADKGLVAAL